MNNLDVDILVTCTVSYINLADHEQERLVYQSAFHTRSPDGWAAETSDLIKRPRSFFLSK